MSLITIDELDMAVPDARFEDLVKYIEFLNAGMERFQIDTPARMAAFIAQIGHESGDFVHVEENLNYSAQGLRRTWPARFPSDEFAQRYHRNPERIANYVYGDRNGNGPEQSGDGWRFRGRGLIQITFRDNYAAYSRAISDSTILGNPAQVAQPRHAVMSACWFWHSKGLNQFADTGTEDDFNETTRRINGGFNGKADRLDNWAEARAILVA